jgi:two-component system, NarL family, invasion response regulator UvrY
VNTLELISVSTSTACIRVFILEDHPIMRKGICALLRLHADLTVCGEAADIATALEQVPAAQPDVVIVDLTFKRGSGFEFIERAQADWPHIKTLVLSMRDEPECVARALRAGAGGFVVKDEPPELIVQGLRVVLAGRRFLSPKARVALDR